MASYFLRVKHVSRGKGARVTRAAAYRAGERIRDERTNEVYNHSKRDDVAYKEVVLPAELAGRADMEWTQDRARLWNAAEHAGRRRNSRLAREVLVRLPPELTAAQRARLVQTFARELADKYRCAIDLSIHEPRAGADRRNYHAHLLMTTREVTPEGLGARTILELGGRERHLRGLGPTKADYLLMRERWAQVTNRELQAAGLAARVDHRSFKDQGIDREPAAGVPEKVFYAERKSGVRSQAGGAIRARHRERVEARLKGSDELARVVQKQKDEHRARALDELKQERGLAKKIRWGALTREEQNRERRERYKATREERSRNQERETKGQETDRRSQEKGAALKERRGQMRAEAKPTQAQRDPMKLVQQSSPTAEDSVRNWVTYRQTHKPGPTAEESARNWSAFRERQKQGDPALTPAAERLSERGTEANRHDSDDDENDERRKKDRSRDHDYGL